MTTKRKKGLKKNPQVIIMSRVKDLGPGKVTSKLKPGFVKYLISNSVCMYKKGNEEIVEARIKQLDEDDAKKTLEAQEILAKMNNMVITIVRESGSGGALYGSVSAVDIYKQLIKAGININKGDIDLNTIKCLGEYNAQVRLYGGIKAKIAINVRSQVVGG